MTLFIDWQVYGVDQGGPALTGTAEVFITVTDANNKLPVFDQDLYLISILESKFSLSCLARVQYLRWFNIGITWWQHCDSA